MTVLARVAGAAQLVIGLGGAVGLLSLISLVSAVGIGVMLPLIPLYAVELGAAPVQLGLLTSSFSVANTVSQLASGFGMDRLGTLGFIRAGTAVYAGANFLIAVATGPLSLIAYRSVAGLGAGANLLATRVYVTQVAPQERLGLVNGVLGAAHSAGTVLGPALGGLIVALAGLRAPFVLVGITSGLAFLATLLLPRPAPARRSAAGAAAPLPLTNRAVVVLLLSNLLLLAAYGGFITTYAPFATAALGWSPIEVALLFSFMGGGSILLGPGLGHVADRTGRRRVAALASVPIALTAVVLVLELPRLVLYGTMFLGGGGLAAYQAAWFAMLSQASPEARRGRTFGIVSAVSNLGVVIGAMSAATVWQLVDIGTALLTAAGFTLLAGAVLLGHPASPSRGPGATSP